MKNIEIYDCTLREGGYENNWNFKKDNITSLINLLYSARINYVECGYLNSSIVYDIDRTLFSNYNQFRKITSLNDNSFLMINYGEVQFDDIKNEKNLNLTVAFKKKDCLSALEFCENLVNLGFKIFINPMSTNLYSFSELEKIILKTNQMKAYALTIVDSFGSMKSDDILKIYEFVDSNLDKNIAISLHLHDGLNEAIFAINEIIKRKTDRKIIIQTSLSGIGRGVGNLKTEEIVRLFNKYDFDLIDCANEKHIAANFAKKSEETIKIYQFCSQNNTHPNYAKFLIDNKISYQNSQKIISDIPYENKTLYNKKIIENLLLKLPN